MTTSLYIAIALVAFIPLTMHVIKGRNQYKTALLDGGHADLCQRIRAQGNFIESTPFFLIALAMAEHQGLAGLWVHVLGSVFLLGRVLHAYSLLKIERYDGDKLITHARFRVKGMQITFFCFGTLATILLYQYLMLKWG